jgi:hypothetical protein
MVIGAGGVAEEVGRRHQPVASRRQCSSRRGRQNRPTKHELISIRKWSETT